MTTSGRMTTTGMNSRERFHATMNFGHPDRVPYFEEGIREEVLSAWRAQGMPGGG